MWQTLCPGARGAALSPCEQSLLHGEYGVPVSFSGRKTPSPSHSLKDNMNIFFSL